MGEETKKIQPMWLQAKIRGDFGSLSPAPPLPRLQKAGEQEEEEEEVEEKKPDPLHQLVLHFSRTALTEKR